jgi:hypothetical protein
MKTEKRKRKRKILLRDKKPKKKNTRIPRKQELT